jgi:hypothetical protein
MLTAALEAEVNAYLAELPDEREEKGFPDKIGYEIGRDHDIHA